jgi:hypothetical protein
MEKIRIFFILICLNASCLNAFEQGDVKGIYIGVNSDYKEYIYFYDGNKFHYVVNLCEFITFVDGIYTIKNDQIVCKIKNKGFKGWPEDKIYEIILNIIRKDKIQFVTKYGCDISNDKIFFLGKTKTLKSKVENLRVRELSNATSKVVGALKKGESVEVISPDKEDVINSIKGNWVLIKTMNNELGYCFDGYLE